MLMLTCLYVYATVHMFMATFQCYSYNSEAASWGVFINSISVIVTLWFLGKYIHEKYALKKYVTVREKKEPGLLAGYYKARHDKVCPMLEWED